MLPGGTGGNENQGNTLSPDDKGWWVGFPRELIDQVPAVVNRRLHFPLTALCTVFCFVFFLAIVLTETY